MNGKRKGKIESRKTLSIDLYSENMSSPFLRVCGLDRYVLYLVAPRLTAGVVFLI
jgi:hypothetical protein